MEYFLVWHSGTPKDVAVELVYAKDESDADRKTGYDGVTNIERPNDSPQAETLFGTVTNKGLRAVRNGEVLRLGEWHLG